MVLSIEIKMLLWSCILGIVQLLAAAQLSTMQRGVMWNLSSREEKMPDLTGAAGRVNRALKNFLETFPFFMAGILMVQVTQMQSSVSVLGAQIYFWARVVYFPVYAVGIPGLRTFIWLISFIGILMVLSALL